MSDIVHSEPPAVYDTGRHDCSMTNEIQAVLNDPSASDWLKLALRSALDRDSVDVTNDAETLFQLLRERCEMILQAYQGEH